MNKIYLYIALAMTTGLAACSSDDNASEGTGGGQNTNNVVNLLPTQATKVAFTSNSVPLSNDVIVGWEDATKTTIDRNAEETSIKSTITDALSDLSKYNTDFMYYAETSDLEFEMYPILLSGSTPWRFQNHYLGLFFYDAGGNIQKQEIFNMGDPWNSLSSTQYIWNAEKGANDVIVTSKGVKVTVKQGYKFGFYWFGNNINNTESYDFYTKVGLNTVLPVNGSSTTSQIHAITFEKDGKTYLATEEWTDFNYDGIAFMFNKEIPTVASSETAPVIEPVIPSTPGEDPVDPVVSSNGGSVEVNLALNAEKATGDWKESHLSIHVRDTTDITLFLPVEAQYYCPKDDMMIVQKHDEAYQYNETATSTSMTINGNVVKLTVNYADNGITISTNGINADVLEYLRTTYGDGLTFEIRNYYNDGLDRTQLQQLLNNSTISFTNAPATYVSANGLSGGVEDALACKVKPQDIANRTEPASGIASAEEGSVLYLYPLK